MENRFLLNRDLDDVVFENRNQAYGAYMLRKTYKNHVRKASMWGISVFALLIAGPSISEKMRADKPKMEYTEMILPPPPDTHEPIITPPPPPKPEPPKKIATITFVPPKVKEDEKVTEPELIPKIEDITVAVSTKTNEGENTTNLPPDFQEVVAPPIEVPEAKETGPAEPTIVPIYGVQQHPEFPDGNTAMYKFLRDNIVYPAVARENGISGTAYVAFVIWTDGSIRNIEGKRGPGGGCLEEAIRVIKLMPNWKPGKQNGKAVPVAFTMPVKFELN
jgi:periplasmic protein TonB